MCVTWSCQSVIFEQELPSVTRVTKSNRVLPSAALPSVTKSYQALPRVTKD